MIKGDMAMTSENSGMDAIHVDVIGDKDGGNRVRSLGTASILGILPTGHMWTVAGPNREQECCGTFHVDVEGQTTHVRCVTTGHTILSGRGLVKTLQMMADMTNTPVIVSHDPGASSTIKNAEYTPSGEFTPVAEVAEVAPVAEITGADVEAARLAIQQNGRVFAAEAHNFAPVAAFAILTESGTHTLVNDGDMSRYVRTRYTADRKVITDGLAVWDYNLNPGRVVLATIDGEGWFNVDTADGRSLMNGERVITAHPSTRQTAEDALTEDAAPLDIPAPGEVEALQAEHDAAMAEWSAPLVSILTRPSLGTIADSLAASDRRHFAALADEVTPVVTEIHTGDGTVITEADVRARFRETFGPPEAEVWEGTGTTVTYPLRRPVRALMGRRKRKATKVNARRVRGGF